MGFDSEDLIQIERTYNMLVIASRTVRPQVQIIQGYIDPLGAIAKVRL